MECQQISYLELLVILSNSNQIWYFPGGYTFPPIIMEVEHYPKRKETNIEGTHVPLPSLWTLPKTNIAPKNGGFAKFGISIFLGIFFILRGSVSFREGVTSWLMVVSN